MKFKFFFALIILVGCTKEVSIEIPEQPKLVVLNSLFPKDSILNISLNTTQSILDNSENTISIANGQLFENDIFIEDLTFQGSNLISTHIARKNNNYKIVVDVPGYETVTAEDEMVENPKLLSATYQDSVYIGDEGDLFSQASIEIKDDANVENYYELNMYLKALGVVGNADSDSSFDRTRSDLFFDVLINDIVIQNEGLLNYLPEKLIFSDELFRDQDYTLKINFRAFNSSFYEDNRTNQIGLVIQLRKVSKNYYQYSKTLTRHLENQFSDIWDGVSQPAPVFSNVENGYGIFAGYASVNDTIFKK